MVTIREKRKAEDDIIRAQNMWDSIKSQAVSAKSILDQIPANAMTVATDGTSTTSGNINALKANLATVSGM